MGNAPTGSLGCFYGLHYKFGRFNWVFFWNGKEWLKSRKTEAWLQHEIDANEY